MTDLAPQTPPHDIDAERAVLGGIMLTADALSVVESIVTADDFYHPAHAIIYDAARAVAIRQEPIDVVTLAAELRLRDRINAVGGAQYLGDLLDTTATTAHIERHARIVADLAQVRRLIHATAEINAKGYTPGDVTEYLDASAARVTELCQRQGTGEPVWLERGLTEAFERIEQTAARGASITGASTGYADLDALLAGLHPGEFTIIAARPAMGKTSLALNLAPVVARETGKPALIFSLEMPRIELVNRMLCAEARVDQARLRTNLLGADDMQALTDAAQRLFAIRVAIDAGDASLYDIRAKARRMKQKHGLACVIVDYLQLMRGTGDSREQEIAGISRGLKLLATELDVPVIALSQLNRAPEMRPGKDRRPQLSDLRESGAIEQDADNVLFIYRDEMYNRDSEDKGVAEIIIAKQRNGPTGIVRLRWLQELTRFENFAEDDERRARPIHKPSRGSKAMERFAASRNGGAS